ncbi:single-stranded DNA-binding protein [Streptomyces sp. NPDC018055]|uniref:single-stranded DNA-binding protein n=1 Tax=Streptomyces sp. NPDC018055 TaxID=3365038 RepID=UPI0037A60DC8
MSSTITLTGRLTAAPEIRFTAQGTAVVAFTIVTSRRVKNQQTNEWSDADVTYWDCKAFKQLAQNIADSLDKGMEVVATGRAVQESWEDRQTGAKRSKVAVLLDAIGPSLRSATAVVTKAGSGGQGREEFQRARAQQGAASAEDPWASGAPASAPAGGGWGSGAQGGGYDDPPF